ncbi:LacI family DNA-binding transcriptional regulator [Zhihengliuella flava]|uniref:DNA-binding LacI/PurR family transcriptional regulator n=1 Tax=Zhihengliuella flava TaxID=1285193 RepID=A0A931D959_9MICC|nr:LacI family DNA-binding transcriptional regulator [Zhihengliuella flava]MBG6084297.1 DNA-binding LacI/PurR family transcriptional regulator [Zhihengliuella flava]
MTTQRAGKRATIIEVAQEAGVSHQTVSRYLRSETGMRPETRERIKAAITKLGYRPNIAARAMRDRRTGRLALLLPTGVAISALEVLKGATEAAEAHGYVVEAVTLGGDAHKRYQRVLELADCGLFEGLVSLTPIPEVEQLAPTMSTPVAVETRYDESMRGIGELASGQRIVDLVEGLASRGHTTFLHIAGNYTNTTARYRRDAYVQTIERLGLISRGVVEANWDPEAARRGVLDLPESAGVTAIITANDQLAAGAIAGAVERGWRVPQDLSVTGWDNTEVGAIMPPGLTSVAIDFHSIGRRAIRRLLGMLDVDLEPEPERSLTEVIWRGSTGPAPAR